MPTWQGIPGKDHLVIDNAAGSIEPALTVRQREPSQPVLELLNAAGTAVVSANYDGTVTGTTPTIAAHLATKAYVDGAVLAAGAHDVLSATHTDTLTGAVLAGDLLVGNATPKWTRLAKGAAATVLKAGAAVLEWGSVAFTELTGTLSNSQHGTLSGGDHSGTLSGNARVGVRVNSAGSTHTRRRINLIPGTNVQISHADDSGNEEVDVTIAASASASAHSLLSVSHPDTLPAAVTRGALVIGNSSPAWSRLLVGTAGQVPKTDGTDVTWGSVAFTELTGTISNSQHGSLSGGDHTGELSGNARVVVKKAGATIGTRRGINLHEGTNVSLTIGDDAGNEEVDVTIAVAGEMHARQHALDSAPDHSGTLADSQLASGVTQTGEASKIPKLDASQRLRLGADPSNVLDAATMQFVTARAATKGRALYLAVPGVVAAGTTVSMIVPSPIAGVITAVKSTCRVAASTTYTLDIHKGGTTIYTTQGNRPQRTSGNGTGLVAHTAPDVTAISADDLFTVDVDTAGTGLEDLLVAIYFTEG